uniref:Uncharacterized protein n=1 Tax=Moniliophthora roreri TaxID=221103 RepID=A0A0W0FQ32_MONRR
MPTSSQRRHTRNSPASTNKRSYPTPPNPISIPSSSHQPIAGSSRDVYMEEMLEGCTTKLLVYTQIIMECAEYLRMYPHEWDQIYQELEAQHPANPNIFDKPKEDLDIMQAEYDGLLDQTSNPDSVCGYLMRMAYAHTAMQLYLSVQVFPRTARDPEFFRRWDAAYTQGNTALLERVPAPGPYTAPMSKVLASQFANKAAIEPSRSERADTSMRHSQSLEEAKDLLKDVGMLLSKRFRYLTEEEMVDWRVICIQQRAGNQFQYVVEFSDDEAVFDEELVIDLLIDSVDV